MTPAQKLNPRSFLLSQVPLVAKHALLLVHWEQDGAALLSMPTREYLQCSIWTEVPPALPVEPDVPKPVNDIRPETQLSLGSADPRYKDFDTVSSHPGHSVTHGKGRSNRALPDWSNEHDQLDHAVDAALNDVASPGSPTGNVMDHADAAGHVEGLGFTPFDFGLADAFATITPDSSWDYRANRTAVVYDSGDDSEGDFAHANTASKATRGLELQTDILRIGAGQSGVIISEGVALSPSDVDSDLDGNAAAIASRFVMEERMRRVYGPLEGDVAESDELDLTSIDQQPDRGNDSDATEDAQHVNGPTRVGKLKREKLRRKEEMELERARMEEQGIALEGLAAEKAEASSMRSQTPPPSNPLPPMPPGTIDAWQAGLLYALTR